MHGWIDRSLGAHLPTRLTPRPGCSTTQAAPQSTRAPPSEMAKSRLRGRVCSPPPEEANWAGMNATWPVQDILLLFFVRARINHPFITSAHSRYPHYCKTIARLLRHIHPPSPTLPLYATHHRILVMTISCKGRLTAG